MYLYILIYTYIRKTKRKTKDEKASCTFLKISETELYGRTKRGEIPEKQKS